MDIIRGDRVSGKTMELIKISHYLNLPILCISKFSAQDIQRKAKEMNLTIPAPIVDIAQLEGSGITEILVDEFDYILEKLLGVKVRFATTSCNIVNVLKESLFMF